MNRDPLSRQCPINASPYIIQGGDTIGKIAKNHNITVSDILAANPGIIPEQLSVGQTICIPQNSSQQGAAACPIGSSPYEVKKGDTISAIARRFNTTVESILLANPNVNPEGLYVGQIICVVQEKSEQANCPLMNSYVVQKGDSISTIAKAFNVSLLSVLKANPTVKPETLYVNQVICVPVAPLPMRISVSIKAKILSVYKNGSLFKTYPIACGKVSTPSPIGTFKIINKQVNPGGPYGTRWMGLSEPHYGIHGTNNPPSIGTAASNGCIRMYNKDVEDLFNYVTVGTPVTIY